MSDAGFIREGSPTNIDNGRSFHSLGSLFYLESQGLLKPSTHPSTHSVNRKESKTGGTRSTRNENTDDSQADTSADLRELDNENSEPKRKSQ